MLMLHALLSPIRCPPCIVGLIVAPQKLKATFRNGNPMRPAPDYFPLHAVSHALGRAAIMSTQMGLLLVIRQVR
jgi:hypothetical protein